MRCKEENLGRQPVWKQRHGADSVLAGSYQRRMGWVMGLCRTNSGPWAGPVCHSPLGCWVSWSWRLGWVAGERVLGGGTR